MDKGCSLTFHMPREKPRDAPIPLQLTIPCIFPKPSQLVLQSLGFEGFNVTCQSKQTQHIQENNMSNLFA